jgi:arabinofuranan 3-O-arabinosyltransferase
MDRTQDVRASRRLAAIGFGIATGCAGALAGMFQAGLWIVDGNGRPLIDDFLAPYAAGRMALEGQAAFAYNPWIHHAVETRLVGHGFTGGLAWPYPPQFFLVTAPLALLPYTAAFLIWALGTLAAYAVVAGLIARRSQGALLALVPPFVFGGLYLGQTGFFTAAVLGAALLALEKRPVLSGFLFAVLTIKPQFGLLIPFALAASGQWRSFASAALGTALLTLAALGIFGFDTVPAFLTELPMTSHDLLVKGWLGWSKIQSVFGMTRWLGGPHALAVALQAATTFGCAVFVTLLWRSRAPLSLKSAGLAAAVLLATPYSFVYDMPFLAIAAAFLYRERAFDRVESFAVLAALVPMVLYTAAPTPLPLLSTLTIFALVVRRARGAMASSENLSAASLWLLRRSP